VKKTFRGGTHPPEFKLTADKAGEILPLPGVVYIPVSQHIGAPGKVLVSKGDEVKLGQPLTEPGGFVSAPVHASVSGVVKAIGPYVNSVGREVPTITVENDGKDEWYEAVQEDKDWEKATPDVIRDRVRDAGLAGMGGAAFPTHVKLSPPKEKTIDTIIINGAECEPYLTSDHRLMLEHPHEILAGARIVAKTVNAKKIFIGIESNKPDAFEVLKKEAKANFPEIIVEMLPVKYPQGAEKQLINALTGREVPPPPALPMDVGCIVQNVGTCIAIYDAVRYRRPLVERYVTISGSSVKSPKNVIARIGTPLTELIKSAGGYLDGAYKLLSGGPMMGMAQWTDLVPVTKGTSGIVVMNREEAVIAEEQPCIGCSRCVSVCPMFLLPTNIARLGQLSMLEEAEKLGSLECIECGSCSFICPSKRNLIQHIRFGKAGIMAEKRKQSQKQSA
jgi:H+/Na+-translocating ferredoxin:NAD+ oxidoreductase subunit C